MWCELFLICTIGIIASTAIYFGGIELSYLYHESKGAFWLIITTILITTFIAFMAVIECSQL